MLEKGINKQEEERSLNDIQAAAFLGLHHQTLRNWRTQSKGPAYVKLGRAVRYRLYDLRDYMTENRVSNTG